MYERDERLNSINTVSLPNNGPNSETDGYQMYKGGKAFKALCAQI